MSGRSGIPIETDHPHPKLLGPLAFCLKEKTISNTTRLDDYPSLAKWIAEAKAQLQPRVTVADIAGFLTARREDLIERTQDLPAVVRTAILSELIDLVVRRMFEIACTAGGDNPALLVKAERSLALVATGGYGRRELAPYSDIDINFLAASDDDPEIDEITRRMFRLIMDVFLAEAKLKVGYAYRLLGEAAAMHHQNQTALLDGRHVTGSRELVQSFQDDLRRNIHPVAFINEKLRERESAANRHGRGIYRVEPEIKEGEGSLRDLHLTSWLAQVAYGFGTETVWEDIRSHGLLTSAEVSRVYEVMEFFSGIRWKMHLEAGVQADALTVQRQDVIAPKLGYEETAYAPAAAAMMRDYYAYAESARRMAEKMIMRARSKRLELEPGLSTESGQVVLDNPEAFLNDPVACLRAYAYCQKYELKLSQDVIDAIRICVVRMPAPLEDADAAKVFLMILRSEHVADAIIGMTHSGVLGWFIPEFGRIMGQIPFDAAHEFTVGWHSAMVVYHCERLVSSTDEEMRRIYAGIRHPELLYLFALLHDVAKGLGGEHAERGADMSKCIGERLGMDSESVSRLEFLVRNHLLMSDTARLRDLNLRKTVDDFVAVVNDVDSMSMLFIVTNADILAVGSSAWSEIQGRFLKELYYRAERSIITKTPLIDSEEDMALYRKRVRRELSLTSLPEQAVEEHVALMPAMYLLNTSPEEMAEHVEFIRRAGEDEPSVAFRAEMGSDYTELTICVKDDPEPGLLSKITGALWALDIDVHAAQVFTRENAVKIALDTLYVDFEGQQLPEFKKHQVEKDLIQVLKGHISAEDLLKRYHKKLGSKFEVKKLLVHEHLSEEHTVVDIQAKDNPGLLYRFTRAFARLGWGIHSARVSTWGNEGRDSFYLTQGDHKLEEGAVELLMAALAETNSE